MVIRIAKLEAALRVNAALLVHAQRGLNRRLHGTDNQTKPPSISELIRLLDGPAQREAKRLAGRSARRGWKRALRRRPAVLLLIRLEVFRLGFGRRSLGAVRQGFCLSLPRFGQIGSKRFSGDFILYLAQRFDP